MYYNNYGYQGANYNQPYNVTYQPAVAAGKSQPQPQSSAGQTPQPDPNAFYPLPVTIGKKDREHWQWLQDTMGYTFAFDPTTKEYFYFDASSSITYDYTPYYTSLGYKDGKPPKKLLQESLKAQAQAQAASEALGSIGTLPVPVGAGAGNNAAVDSNPNVDLNQSSKKRKILRAAGGEVWTDKNLEEFDPNDYRMFVGDLGKEVSDDMLKKAFIDYHSVAKVKVVRDNKTGYSKGYGFVSFTDPNDFIKAFKEMNGKYVGNRPIKLRKSTWKERNITVSKLRKDDSLAKVYQKVKKHLK